MADRYVTEDGLTMRVGGRAWKWHKLNLAHIHGLLRQAAHKPTIRQKALASLASKLGTKESPPDSNKCWASLWYGVIGPWCAMSASWAYATAGSKRFVRGKLYAYVPFIVRDARAKQNGLSVTTTPIPGDLVTYDWEKDGLPDHVGIFEKWHVKGRSFYAIEGNTGPENFSNGGEVMRCLRDVSLVCSFVRVKG